MDDVRVMSRNGLEDKALDEKTERTTGSVHNCNQVEQNIEAGVQLLPGIPNEITINEIAPKLPWTAFHILSSVSHGWRRTIQSHQVYDARVRSKSTQTLVAMDSWTSSEEMLVAMDHRTWYDDGIRTIALYSLKSDTSYHLPLIADLHEGIPFSCACVFLDGKLYVLGGLKDGFMSLGDVSADVYVLDIAGQRHWKRCASMETARKHFDCGVKDGKIYVFGGTCESEPICGSETYDPKQDVWSPIAPMPSSRFKGKVTIVGEELFLHSDHCFSSDFFERTRDLVIGFDDTLSRHVEDAAFAEVYHPIKNEWRIVERLTASELNAVSLMGGNLQRVNRDGIQAFDSLTNSWKPLQPISVGVYEANHLSIVQVLAAVSVDDEVLAAVYWRLRDEVFWRLRDEEDEEENEGYCLIRSQGLGSRSREFVWQKLQDQVSPFMCPIEL